MRVQVQDRILASMKSGMSLHQAIVHEQIPAEVVQRLITLDPGFAQSVQLLKRLSR